MSTAPEVPFRLRRPVTTLWRTPSALQLGLDADALVLDSAPSAVADAIELLREPLTPTQLAHRVPALGVAEARWLCAHLSREGFLTTDSPQLTPSVAVLGQGPLAAATVDALRQVAVPVQRLDRAGLTDAIDHDQMVVVAAPTAEPDRVDLARLRSAGRPHLVVRIEASRAVVGPFVEPRVSACVHCDDLARAHRDPAWAQLLQQLSRRRVTPDPGLLAWAADTAVNQIRAWHRGISPETYNRCIELGLDSFAQRQRPVVRHPDCGCDDPLLENH
ncbi:MAG TPA: hypothetical protein DCM67_08010 [Propionibacteriaceae bacterium]|nr:hypothetical protein [Propionibacteriaceae bacterium]